MDGAFAYDRWAKCRWIYRIQRIRSGKRSFDPSVRFWERVYRDIWKCCSGHGMEKHVPILAGNGESSIRPNSRRWQAIAIAAHKCHRRNAQAIGNASGNVTFTSKARRGSAVGSSEGVEPVRSFRTLASDGIRDW